MRGRLTAAARALDEHFILILLVVALGIVSGMLVIELATQQPQRYTGFGLLDESGTTGGFPLEVPHNGTLVVNTNVLNREGKPSLYRVSILVGDDATTMDPIDGSTGALLVDSFTSLVDDGDTWEKTVSIPFDETLVGYKKVIFELWVYDVASSTFTFTGQSLHLWIDVLAP